MGRWLPRGSWWAGDADYVSTIDSSEVQRLAAENVAGIQRDMNVSVAQVQADANKYGYRMSYNEAQRIALAKEFSARMDALKGISMAEKSAVAQITGKRLDKEGLLGSASIRAEVDKLVGQYQKEATIRSAGISGKYNLETGKVYAGAQRYTAEQERLKGREVANISGEYALRSSTVAAEAEKYKSRFSLKETERASQAQEFTADRQMTGTFGAASASANSNVVTSGMGSFFAGQRLGTQWTFRDPTILGAIKRSFAAGFIFILGVVVFFVAMDMFGFPVLSTAADIVAVATGKAIAIVDAVKEATAQGNWNAAQSFLDNSWASVAGGVGGMMTAFVDRMGQLINGVVNWLTDAVANFTSSVSGLF